MNELLNKIKSGRPRRLDVLPELRNVQARQRDRGHIMGIDEYSVNEGEWATLPIVFAHLFGSTVARWRESRRCCAEPRHPQLVRLIGERREKALELHALVVAASIRASPRKALTAIPQMTEAERRKKWQHPEAASGDRCP
jgi:hypothetical protein